MRPDRTNYEMLLIDYLDGILDELQVKQLVSFLEENPDIKEEFSEIITFNVKPLSGSFKHKISLKKNVSDLSDNQFEYLCVSAAENDLSEQQRNELDNIIQGSKQKQITYDQIHRVKLIPPNVNYSRKSSLRKLTVANKILRLSSIGLSAAAGLALIVTIFNLPDRQQSPDKSVPPITVAIGSNTLNSNNISAAANSGTRPEKEEETVPFIVSPPVSDSGEEKTESGIISLPKIKFLQDVSMGQKEFTRTLVAINTEEITPPEEIEEPGFNDFMAKTFRHSILRSHNVESGSLKVYEIAEAGINGLNKLLGWEMSLQKTRDKKGDLKSLYFSSKILKFNAPVKKDQLGS